jgi:FkbM family methyltransferase
MLKASIKHHTAVFVARNRRNRALQVAAHAARRYIEIIENRHYEFAENGEEWLLARVGATRPAVVFDVGANIGDWTAEVRKAAPGAEVHSFELIPPTAAKLSERFKHDLSVYTVGSGLLDEPGTVEVTHYPGEPVLSGVALAGAEHPFVHETLQVPVVRGDDYCDTHGIDRIDYLKIDAEGSDHLVLKGFERMLRAGAVGAVQFEYGRANAANHFLLADFYDLLVGAGMVVGKLYPTYVDFRDYDVTHEDFIGPNFVAVQEDRSDLIRLLAG